jgi:shikimate dehydrogenase
MRMPPSAHVVITDSTGVVAILGDALEQARAPGLVDAIPAERGQDAELVPLRVAREAAGDDRVGSARAVPSSRGAVMTMPHKTAVVDLLDEVLRTLGWWVRAT